MSSHEIAAYAGHPSVGSDDLVAFWTGRDLLDEEEARARVADVLFVATDPQGGLAGIGSAFLARHPQLLMTLWHYRTFIAPEHRRSALALAMAERSQELLEARWISGRDVRGGGLVFDLQSPILREHFREGVWPRTRMAFFGRRPEADMRVRYFRGALVPDPPG